MRRHQDRIDNKFDSIDRNNAQIESNKARIDELKNRQRNGDISVGGERKGLIRENMRLHEENLESARQISNSQKEIVDFYIFDRDGSGAIDSIELNAWEHANGSTIPTLDPMDILVGGGASALLARGLARNSLSSSSRVAWNNGWRTPDGKFASPNGKGLPGASAEKATWEAIKSKPGWRVIEGRVSVRDASGQLRVYDGAAVSPRGRVIGLETKSGSATRNAKQRTFDSGVNTQNPAVGVGKYDGVLEVGRAIEIRR